MPTGALIEENPLHAAALLSIPPNTVARHERFWPLPKPALVISFQPHMHFRGSRMLLEAIHPDGRREVLTDATHYEQTWQITYRYKTPHLFPAGTILHTVSWHDNTANNKHNPDPTAWMAGAAGRWTRWATGGPTSRSSPNEQYQEELAKRRAPKRDEQRTRGSSKGRTRSSRRRHEEHEGRTKNSIGGFRVLRGMPSCLRARLSLVTKGAGMKTLRSIVAAGVSCILGALALDARQPAAPAVPGRRRRHRRRRHRRQGARGRRLGHCRDHRPADEVRADRRHRRSRAAI